MSPVLSSLLERTWTHASHSRPMALYLTLSIALYLISRLLYTTLLYPRFFSPLRNLPGPPLGDPIYGRFAEIMRTEAGVPQREWVKKHGPVVRAVGPLGIERLIFMSPEACQKILVSDWVDYPRPKFMRDTLGLVAGYGLLTVTGNEHKQMRKAMNPAFSINNLMAQSDMYYDAIESLVEFINAQIDAQPDPHNGAELLMYEWLAKATLDIICATAFGYTTDSLHNPHNELAEAYEKLTSLQTGPNLARFIAVVSIPGFARFLNSDFAHRHRKWFGYLGPFAQITHLLTSMSRIRAVSASILASKTREAAASLPNDADAKRDIMSLLVRARAGVDEGKEGFTLSDGAMMDQVLTFLGAGHETTASGLAWTLWLLANDPISQSKLREEVTPLFASTSTSTSTEAPPRPGYRALKDLAWLDCVVQESLRVLPPVPMTFRQAAKTDYIDGVLVPEGTLFYVPIRVINTWKEVWGPDAEEFKPSRWLNLPPKYNPAFSTLSFIAGPHACIGKTMAIIEMKAVLGALITHSEFSPAYEGQVPQPTAAVTMKPKDNMPLRVKRVKRD